MFLSHQDTRSVFPLVVSPSEKYARQIESFPLKLGWTFKNIFETAQLFIGKYDDFSLDSFGRRLRSYPGFQHIFKESLVTNPSGKVENSVERCSSKQKKNYPP